MEATAQGGGMITWLLLMAVMFIVLIFMPARSQKKREQELAAKVNALQKGDGVILSGGIVGTIAGFKDNLLEIKLAENVKIHVLKTAIVGLVKDLQATNNEGGAK